MVERNIWVERKFEFSLPKWMFPNTIARVRGGPARVEDLVRGLPENVIVKRIGDRWSMKEQIGHLLDLEQLWSTRLNELVQGATHLTAWEETNRATYEANHNSTSLEALLRNFRNARSAFVKCLDELDDSLIEQTALHPTSKTYAYN